MTSRKRCYMAAFAALMAGSTTTIDAFVHPVAVATVKPKAAAGTTIRRSVRDYPSEDYQKEQQRNTESVPLPPQDVSAAASTPVSTIPPVTTTLENDLSSKTVLLESISRVRPEDFLADAVVEKSLTSNNNGSSPVMGPSTTTTSNATILENGGNLATPGFLEDVKAVLAFSEEAAAEAEATMPPELVERLEIGSGAASAPSNSTETVVPSFTVSTNNADRPSSVDTDKEVFAVRQVPPVAAQDENVSVAPASKVAGKPAIKAIEAPDVRKILKFAIPAIGVWLCGPLLSLIDTSAVGIFSGTVQQAALNPAVAVTDYAALLIAFMYTGTTNMVAAAQESDRGTADKPRTAKTMIGAMQLSTYIGAGLGIILFTFARPLLKAIIGNDAISPAVFAAAMKYVRIRALGMPAAAIIGSTQAACLGMQDIRSPLYVLVAAAVVNFFGDILFVGNSHPLIGGAAGAAWATIISQYVAVAFFIRWLRNKPEKKRSVVPQVMNVSDAILKMTGKPGEKVAKSKRQSLYDVMEAVKMTTRRRQLQERLESFAADRKGKRVGRVVDKLLGSKKMASLGTAKKESVTVRGFLQDRFSIKDMFQFPNKATRDEFAPYVIPVTTTQVGRVSGYVAMSHVVASSLGTVSMAAQQVIVSLFYCLCPIADSLSLTAQSFIPGIAEKNASPEQAAALRKVTMSLLKAGAVFGGAMMAAVSAIPLLSGFFTSDPAVISLVNSVVPLLLVFFGVHGFVCASEGVLLGQKDLGFLGKMYSVFFGAVPFLMLRVKRAALTGSRAVNLTSVWKIFVGYQIVRCGIWLVRSSMLQRRSNRDAAAAAEADQNAIAP